ncbi:MAG: triose-phosphate isomerase [Alphaproteobacteria bacterium]|nr:triose-phosphate isomerase [Alphaproteobacteria bacterium]
MKIIAGNWKMNGTQSALEEMQDAMGKIMTDNTVILCVPFTLISGAKGPAAVGAQDVSTHDKGAFTGEISAEMLVAAGAKYVIVGHSERRMYHGETNEIVNQKAKMALSAGLTPIICVGETMDERKAGKTMEIIESGVRESVPMGGGNVIVAYEPRWAIGAGITPTDDEIATAHTLIADILAKMGRGGTPILYGASVKGANATQIMSIPHVDGVLVGGASLKPDDFIPIIMATK